MFISVDEDATLFDDSCITCKTPDTQERPQELDLEGPPRSHRKC